MLITEDYIAKIINDFSVEKIRSVVKDELLDCYFMTYVPKILHTYRPFAYIDCFAKKRARSRVVFFCAVSFICFSTGGIFNRPLVFISRIFFKISKPEFFISRFFEIQKRAYKPVILSFV